jgi:hypothetical protein
MSPEFKEAALYSINRVIAKAMDHPMTPPFPRRITYEHGDTGYLMDLARMGAEAEANGWEIIAVELFSRATAADPLCSVLCMAVKGVKKPDFLAGINDINFRYFAPQEIIDMLKPPTP